MQQMTNSGTDTEETLGEVIRDLFLVNPNSTAFYKKKTFIVLVICIFVIFYILTSNEVNVVTIFALDFCSLLVAGIICTEHIWTLYRYYFVLKQLIQLL